MDVVLGLDFGTDSVRAVAVDAATGRVLAAKSAAYRRWAEKRYCDAAKQIFRQHPSDYIEAMTQAVRAAAEALTPEQWQSIRAIGTDATGTTLCPVDETGTPLALLEDFAQDPEAMFHLWKDHYSTAEAREIIRAFRAGPTDYLQYQGDYSSEWYWAKILRVVRSSPAIRERAAHWVELADWVPSMLAGRDRPGAFYRNVCSAGHKATWNSHFGGFPDRATLAGLDPYLAHIADTHETPGMATDVVGALTPEWSEKLHLPAGTLVAGSSMDAHAGAVGAGIRPGVLVEVVGTSTVEMTVVKEDALAGKDFRRVCGAAENSILPGYMGLESGQSAFGDLFAWLTDLLCWPTDHDPLLSETDKHRIRENLLDSLTRALPADDDLTDLTVLDWFNGRRYPDKSDKLPAAAMGLTLAADAPRLLRALMLGAVMGSKAIYQGFLDAGLHFEEMIALGGIAQKSPVIMQLLCDALDLPIRVPNSMETCALGSAMYAAVAAGIYPDLTAAITHMHGGWAAHYRPDPARRPRLETCWQQYQKLAAFTEAWHTQA